MLFHKTILDFVPSLYSFSALELTGILTTNER